MTDKLAINGGTPHIPAGSVLPSPPTTALDEEYVLASLRGPKHAWAKTAFCWKKNGRNGTAINIVRR